MPEQLAVEPLKNDSPEAIRGWLEAGRYDIEWPATKGDIKTIFRNRGGQTNKPAQDDDLQVALNRRFIIEQPPSTRVKGQKHVKFVLNPSEFPETKAPNGEVLTPDMFKPKDGDTPF